MADKANNRRGRWWKIPLGILTSFIVLIFVALSVALSGPVLTRIASSLAVGYVDGDVSVGRVSASIFRSFPNVKLNIEDLLVTYPHDRFASYDSLGIRSPLTEAGRGEETDTLAQVGRLSASLDYIALSRGRIDVPLVELDGLRLFAHYYDSTAANWDIIVLPERQDTVSKPLPEISVRRVSIKGDPRVFFSDRQDTLFAFVGFNALSFKGIVENDLLHSLGKPDRSVRERLSLELDSLTLAARLPADTVAAAFNRLRIFEHKDHMDIQLGADLHLFTQLLGRMDVPVDIDAEIGFPAVPEGQFALDIQEFEAHIASLPLRVQGAAVFSDSTYVDVTATVSECPIGTIIDDYGAHFADIASQIRTDAVIDLEAQAKGWFGGGSSASLPAFYAHLEVPDSHISYSDLIANGDFDLDVSGTMSQDGRVDVLLDDLCFAIKGLDLNMNGSAGDLLGDDPLFWVDLTACTQMEDLMRFLPPDVGIIAAGDVDLDIEGSIRASQMSLYNFSKSSVKGRIFSEGMTFGIPEDGLYAVAHHPDIRISVVPSGTDEAVGLNATIDSLRLSSGADMYIVGSALKLTARNSGAVVSSSGTLQPLKATLSASSVNLRGADSLAVALRGSSNQLTISHPGGDKSRRYDFSSANDYALVRASGFGRAVLQGLELSTGASTREGTRPSRRAENDGRVRGAMDSLRRLHPGATRDSLMRIAGSGPNVPDFLSEKDFRAHDIKVEVTENVRKMFRQWRPEASVKVASASVSTPLLPLTNRVTTLDCSVNDNDLEIKRLLLNSGSSTIGLTAQFKGLRQLISGRPGMAPMDLEAYIHSRRVNLNELIAAVVAGTSVKADESIESEDYGSFVTDTLENVEMRVDNSLLVVPANLRARLSLDLDSLNYSKISVGSFISEIEMRERCLQITGARAVTDFGALTLDAFYSTRTKQDIQAGFNLGLEDITAADVISIVPVVDSLVPMLKSFKGQLDCEFAATTQLDTNMNVLIPTLNGTVQLGGRDLELEDTGDLRKIAKLLMFKDVNVGHIRDMSVNGIIGNNTLEIFPFILGVDRYTLALQGTQRFDSDFKYHVSVIKSPLPFKFGLNLFGNFSDWKYRVGKARYKNTNIPVFTAQVDTMRINLATSIRDIFRKGVDIAVRENAESGRRLDLHREQVYAEYPDDEDAGEMFLSSEDQKTLDVYLVEQEIDEQSRALEEELEAFFAEEFVFEVPQ